MSNPELTEEQLKQLEEEMEQVRIQDLLMQTVVTVLNLGARKAQADNPDFAQLKTAIDACRALLPIVETEHGEQLAPIRDALSQLQQLYVQKTATTAPLDDQKTSGKQAGAKKTAPTDEHQAGPAERSGRLWVPGSPNTK